MTSQLSSGGRIIDLGLRALRFDRRLTQGLLGEGSLVSSDPERPSGATLSALSSAANCCHLPCRPWRRWREGPHVALVLGSPGHAHLCPRESTVGTGLSR